MNNRLCPCGARLDRSSTTRSLKSTGLRMFMSMRTMISWPTDTKVCNICRLLYGKGKIPNFPGLFHYWKVKMMMTMVGVSLHR